MGRGKRKSVKARAGDRRHTGFWKHDKRGRWGNSERRRKEVPLQRCCRAAREGGRDACYALQLRRVAERKPSQPMALRRCFQALRIAVNNEHKIIQVRAVPAASGVCG